MPVRLFWYLSRHVDRIRADRELRLFDLHLIASSAAMGGGKEVIDNYKATLIQQKGVVVKTKEKVSSKDDILKLMEL